MRSTRDRPRSARRTAPLTGRRSVKGATGHATPPRSGPGRPPRHGTSGRVSSAPVAARRSPPPIDITRALLLALLIAFLTMIVLPFLLESAAAPYR